LAISKGGGDSFACYISDHQCEAPLTQIKEIVVIAAHLAGLDAGACIFEGLYARWALRKEPGLNLFGYLQFLCGAAFGFQVLGNRLASHFDFPVYFVEAHQGKRVSVPILEAREYSTPNRRLPLWELLPRLGAQI
jgi:hypothetical protein